MSVEDEINYLYDEINRKYEELLTAIRQMDEEYSSKIAELRHYIEDLYQKIEDVEHYWDWLRELEDRITKLEKHNQTVTEVFRLVWDNIERIKAKLRYLENKLK